ncbi:hypothetical protein N7G274_002513 [Stereocaulon virgatum]|uniref:Uncharacterized protein n=1 Tax=Stereocaulon virgatum TaxID=373712 RepID=A0ABR4AMR6_9LECA
MVKKHGPTTSFSDVPAFQLPVTLPLFKISYSTTATPRSSKQWTHLPNRDSMFVVFDMVRKKDLDGVVVERKLLKLVKEGELLEEIELDALTHQARIMEQNAKSRQILYDDLHVLVLVKGQLLAMRYQLQDGQFRKIQMNFQKSSDCDIAFSTLKSIGLPNQDRGQQSYAAVWRPQSSQEAFQSTSQPGSQEQTGFLATVYDWIPSSEQPPRAHSRPTLARPSSSQFQPQERTNDIYVPANDPVPLSNESSQERLRPTSAGLTLPPLPSQQRARAGAVCSTIHVPLPQPARPCQPFSRPTSASSGNYQDDFAKPIPYIRDPRCHLGNFVSGTVPAYNTAARLNPSSSASSPEVNPTVVPSLSPGLLPRPKLGSHPLAVEHEPRPISSPQTQSERLSIDNVTPSQMLPPRRTLPFPEKAGEPVRQGSEVASSLPPRLMSSLDISNQSSSFDYNVQAISEPQTRAESRFIDIVPLSQMLAPKRTLPFPEAKETLASGEDAATIAREPESEPPRSQGADTGSLNQRKSRARNGKSITKRSRRGYSLSSLEPSSSAPKAPTKKTLVVTLNTKKPPPSSAPPRISPPAQERSRQLSLPPSGLAFPSSPPVLNAFNKRPLTTLEGSEPNKRQSQALREPCSSVPQLRAGIFGATLIDMTPAELLDSVDGWIRKFNNLPAIPNQSQTAKELRAEYAKQSDEARAEAIDNFICECLEDENFVKLAEDVEGAWKRIGLGF